VTVLRAALAVLLVAAAGCRLGTTVPKFAPALAPEGVRTTLTLRSGRVQGELLAVTDTAFVIRRYAETPPVALVPYRAIHGSAFHQVGAPVEGGHPPRERDRERLRLVSRFPQGLSPELLQQLLAGYGQTELVVLDR
jgi:hypothetical protein